MPIGLISALQPLKAGRMKKKAGMRLSNLSPLFMMSLKKSIDLDTIKKVPFYNLLTQNKAIIKQLFGFSLSTSLAQFIMMIISIMLARHLGPERFGVLASSYAIGSLTSIIFNLGLDAWLLREGVGSINQGALLGKVLKIKAISGMIWLLVLILMSVVIRPDLYNLRLLLIVALDIWADAIFSTFLVVLNLRRSIVKYSTLLLLSRIAKLVMISALILLGIQNVDSFASSRAFVSILMMIILAILFRSEKNSNSIIKEKSILIAARPYTISDLLAIVYSQVDVTILYLIMGSLEVGIYSPALNMINALFVVPNAIFLYSVPALTNQFNAAKSGFVKMSKKLIRLLFAVGLTLTTVIGALSQPLTNFFLGQRYSLTGEILLYLSPILLIKSLEFGFVAIIVSAMQQNKRLFPQSIAATLNIVLNVLLIPKLGINGAIIVYSATEVILLAGYWCISKRTLKDYSVIEQ